MPAGELWRSQQSVSCPYSPECVERLSGKCSEDALVTYAMLHGDHGEQEIPHRSVRRRMEVHQPPSPPSARAHRTRTPQATRLAGDPRCGLLRSEERMPVAAFAPRVPFSRKTVYDWFRKWRIDGTWERLNAELRERLRCRLGRDPNPSAGIVDSQSARTSGVGGQERGFDPAKNVEGRKRHLLLDTEGLVLKAKVHSARVPDADGIRLLLESARAGLSRLSHLWVDAGYQGRGKRWAEEAMDLSVEVVCKSPKSRSLRRWLEFGPTSGPRRERRWIGRG